MIDTRRPKTPRSRAGTVVLTVLVVLFAGFAAFRLVVSGLFGIDGNRYTIAGLALTPYVAAAGLVLAGLALTLRRWWFGATGLVVCLALAAVVLPRAVPASQPEAAGPEVRILALNMYFGQADAQAVLDAVRRHEVDVLALSELSPAAAAALDEAGLGELLPHQHFLPADAAVGSGIAARHRLEPLELAGPSVFEQPSARVQLADPPGAEAGSFEIVAVHPAPPVTNPGEWHAELGGLPPATPTSAVRVLAGDFNATLDHAALRRVLDTGYADAAAGRGAGLRATWPVRRGFVPFATLDRIAVDERAAATRFELFDVPGADHRAVLATIRLP